MFKDGSYQNYIVLIIGRNNSQRQNQQNDLALSIVDDQFRDNLEVEAWSYAGKPR